MNEPTRHDPDLQSLEARLGATPLQLSAREQQQLLYQCAFAAGKKSSIRFMRCWQGAAAGLLLLLGAMSVPLARDQWVLTAQRARSEFRTPQSPAPISTAPAEMSTQDTIRQQQTPTHSVVDLDAWQLPHHNSQPLTDELAQLEKSDPHLRSLTVGGLTGALLNP